MPSHEVYEDSRQESLAILNAYQEEVSFWYQKIQSNLLLMEEAEQYVAGDNTFVDYIEHGQGELAMTYAINEYAKHLALENTY